MDATIAGEVIGSALTDRDFEHLAQSWIPRNLAELACIRRVTHAESLELFDNKKRHDLSGLLFPYFLPGEARPCAFRLKLDNPPIDAATGKPALKYLSCAGIGNRLYFVPGMSLAELEDTCLPIVISEGEKKTLALYRLSAHETQAVRWLPVGVAGVWAWRGVVREDDKSKRKTSRC